MSAGFPWFRWGESIFAGACRSHLEPWDADALRGEHGHLCALADNQHAEHRHGPAHPPGALGAFGCAATAGWGAWALGRWGASDRPCSKGSLHVDLTSGNQEIEGNRDEYG